MMLDWIKKNYILIAFPLILFISLRDILLSPKLIGHNWDFSFPYPSYLFSRISFFSKYTWLDFNLGSIPILNISHLIPNYIISFVGNKFGSIITTKMLLIFVITTAFFSYKKFLDYLVTKQRENYIFSLLFAFSPFLFNEIIGGSWYMWISLALAPIFFLFLLRVVVGNQWKYLLGFILSSFFVLSSLQNFVCVEILAFAYILYHGYQNSSLLLFLKRYLLLHLVLLGINSYWLINFVFSFNEFNSTVFTNKAFAGNFSGVKNSLQSLLQIMNVSGYLDRNMYSFAIPKYLTYLFYISFFTCWILILHSFFIVKDIRNKVKGVIYFWLFLFLLTAFLVKGGNEPFADLTMLIFNKFPLMKLFRSPQHLMFFPAFIVPLLLTYSFQVYKKLNHEKVIAIFLLAIVFWISGWIYTGDLGKSTLAKQKRDHIDLFELSPDLARFYKSNESNPLYHRIIFLPSVLSPIYKKTPYQNEAQGGIPEYLYLRNPTFTSEDNKFARNFELLFCKKKDFNYISYLALFGVHNIIVRNDIVPTFTECRGRFNKNKIIKRLDKEKRLSKVYWGEYITNYEIKDDFTLLPLFVPNSVRISNDSIDKLHDLTSQKNYIFSRSFYFKSQNTHDEIIKVVSKKVFRNIILEYRKVSPVKYIVKVYNTKEQFPVILSTTFNPNWKVYNPSSTTKDTGKNEYISQKIAGTLQNDNLAIGNWYDIFASKVIVKEDRHFVANGYANSWIIDPVKICSALTNCYRNLEGGYNFEMVIAFEQQKYLYLGISASLGVLILAITVSVFQFKRRGETS